MRRLLVVVALFTVAAAPRAHAIDLHLFGEPLRLDLTESLYLNYHGDPGNGDPSSANYGELLSRLNAQLAWRRFLVGFRFDSAAYVHIPKVGDTAVKPNCGGGPECTGTLQANDLFTNPGHYRRYRQSPYDPRKFFEKFFFSYSGRSVDATLGDFYVNFGRGLVLSIRKLDELGVDTTLLGGKVAVHEGNFSAVAVAGWTNIQNVDEASATYVPDPFDFVAGAHADYRFAGKFLVGAHVVGGLPNACATKDIDATAPTGCATPKQTDYYLRYGANFDAPRLLPWLALYAEYARADDHIAARAQTGNALYAAATAYAGDAAWLVEFKHYRDYRPWHSSNDAFGSLVYMQPPTLERVQTQITDNINITAARARVDLRVNRSLILFLSSELGQLYPTTESQDTLYDFYGGAQLRWNEGRSHAFPLVGYRLEHDDIHHSVEEQLIAIELDAAQALTRGFSIEVQGLLWLRQKGDEITPGSGDNRWREGNVYLSLKWAPRFVAAVGYEFTTIQKELQNQHNFWNGLLQWNITPATSVRLFVGGQRPGLKCISGVCRTFPAFDGAKLEVVVRL